MINGLPAYASSNYQYVDEPMPVHHSGHIRLGNIESTHFIGSYAENTPLISGGGLFDLGFGYFAGESISMFSGISASFYDEAGFLQQTRFKLNHQLALDIMFRVGHAGTASETAISLGINYRLGAKPKRATKTAPAEGDW